MINFNTIQSIKDRHTRNLIITGLALILFTCLYTILFHSKKFDTMENIAFFFFNAIIFFSGLFFIMSGLRIKKKQIENITEITYSDLKKDFSEYEKVGAFREKIKLHLKSVNGDSLCFLINRDELSNPKIGNSYGYKSLYGGA